MLSVLMIGTEISVAQKRKGPLVLPSGRSDSRFFSPDLFKCGRIEMIKTRDEAGGDEKCECMRAWDGASDTKANMISFCSTVDTH